MPGCPHTAATQIPHLPHCFLEEDGRTAGEGDGDDEAEMRRCGDEQRRRRGDAMHGRRTTRRALAGRAGPTTRRRGENTTMRTAVRIEPGRMI